MAGEDLIEIKFRLADGTDIGPSKYTPSTTVASLKEKILAQWPKDKEDGPKTIHDLKLINAGKILENNRTIAECRVPVGELPGGVITMLVVLRLPVTNKNKGNSQHVTSDSHRNKGNWGLKQHIMHFSRPTRVRYGGRNNMINSRMILQRRAAVIAQSYNCVIEDCQNLFRLMFASFCVLFLVLEIKFFYICCYKIHSSAGCKDRKLVTCLIKNPVFSFNHERKQEVAVLGMKFIQFRARKTESI